jgi:hypothetical protein
MKAIAVYPGQKDSVHMAELTTPSLNEIPNGRGVLVRVLRCGVDCSCSTARASPPRPRSFSSTDVVWGRRAPWNWFRVSAAS